MKRKMENALYLDPSESRNKGRVGVIHNQMVKITDLRVEVIFFMEGSFRSVRISLFPTNQRILSVFLKLRMKMARIRLNPVWNELILQLIRSA